MNTAAIIVAAGRGTRAGGDLPKQWQFVGSKRVVDWTLAAFKGHPEINQIVLVINPDDVDHVVELKGVLVVNGGETRDQSVKNGLLALEHSSVDSVLIHDVARACVSKDVVDRVLIGLTKAKGAAPAIRVSDALWFSNADFVEGTRTRDGLYRAQTPQGFHYSEILDAHKRSTGPAADDVEIARQAGIDVLIVDGHEDNLKITTPEDFARAEKLLRGHMDIRLGNGYDVHRFGEGDHVILCGVRIDHSRGLQGHSDADVGMHAVTDAIYGALADGDIGQHFPPSDPQWKGAPSDIFLKHAVGLACSRGFQISNIDCTLVCEYPKIGPNSKAMRSRMAEIMSLEVDRVSIKATTSERLGFTGREEGIAAIATATLVKI
ncbi:MAG: bifunctional 2-C-methyl-D-erythritol 4-phosphate cytidylyltransferase/2-C-methyl-D-erythritol 2,4-cyclodiphosphate synthase [Paracoccaceae bacterium]|nr:bifunctional 2-C-methyl-D-erythritol 4-phosphate cytidylyltransferase/2-C-methyl-D-erythritol 2,4-cyclodiphosphate synthase [Paracoccaceae bacterium]MDG2259103.1 bifunctional 2-C-methyl-D-erythritol 4-phosphate cytidylyltransferase/2-C-methyl-D-erythritol 2,4-cyclodiphosphate synthase [Paracoccaceae bacterium]